LSDQQHHLQLVTMHSYASHCRYTATHDVITVVVADSIIYSAISNFSNMHVSSHQE